MKQIRITNQHFQNRWLLSIGAILLASCGSSSLPSKTAPLHSPLAAYCDTPGYAAKPYCNEAETAPVAKENTSATVLVLNDFDGIQDAHFKNPIFRSGNSRSAPSFQPNGGKALQLAPGKYASSSTSDGLPSDWSQFDVLFLDVFNPSHENQEFLVEIKDTASNDYWSRVNHISLLPPGRTTVSIPVQTAAGEKSMIANRRILDASQISEITLSAISSSAALSVDNIRLQTHESWAHADNKILRFDFGPTGSPQFADFIQVDKNTSYSPNIGFGIATDTYIRAAEDRRHPDDLARDWLSLSGNFDVDLPDGYYRVWVMLEDAGYWEDYPAYREREIWSEQTRVHRATYNHRTFMRKYYAHEHDEDLPKDDIWERYIQKRYKPIEFRTRVTDGQLNLRFSGSTFATTVSALIVYPDDLDRQARLFLGEVEARRKKAFYEEYREYTPATDMHPVMQPLAATVMQPIAGKQNDEQPEAPKVSTASEPNYLTSRRARLKRGPRKPAKIEIKSQDPLKDVFAWTPKTSLETPTTLITSLARNEYQALSVTLYTDKDVKLVRARLYLPTLQKNGYTIRNKLRRRTSDGGTYSMDPILLDPVRTPLKLQPTHPKRLWYLIHANKSAATGVHKGYIEIVPLGSPPQKIPLEVTVWPFELADADIPVGYLGVAPLYPATPFAEIARKQRKDSQHSLELMQRYGMTAVSGGLGGPAYRGYNDDNQIRVNYDDADVSLMNLQPTFKKFHVATYFGLFPRGVPALNKPDGNGNLGAKILRDMLEDIEHHGAIRQWPLLEHFVGDEPHTEDAVDEVINRAKIYRKALDSGITAAFTSIQSSSQIQAKLMGEVDRLYLNNHSAKSIETLTDKYPGACGLYNQQGRYRRGFYLYKMRSVGCGRYWQFAWSSVGADPYYALDTREDDISAVFSTSRGSLTHHIELERFREAIDDLRYLITLEKTLAENPAAPEAEAAARYIQQLLDAMKVGNKTPVPWDEFAMNNLREDVASLIIALTQHTEWSPKYAHLVD